MHLWPFYLTKLNPFIIFSNNNLPKLPIRQLTPFASKLLLGQKLIWAKMVIPPKSLAKMSVS